MEKQYYIKFPDQIFDSLDDRPHLPVEYDSGRALKNMDGEQHWAASVGALRDGVEIYDATIEDTYGPFIQVGGSASRMIIQVNGAAPDDPHQLYNVGRSTPTQPEPDQVVTHGRTYKRVHPEEVWDAEQAVPILAYYVRNNATIPPELALRKFEDGTIKRC